MTSILNYDQASLEDLRERTQYESWLLEAVYDLTEPPVIVDWPEIVYPANGASPTIGGFARGNGILGDWRPAFLEAGAPLVFVTSFKVLDMFVEWILDRNAVPSTYRFMKKIATLENGVTFPPFFAGRQWLQDRLIGLYKQLEPLRGTIIHARHFRSSGGVLRVSSSKTGTVGPEVVITGQALRNLAVVIMSVLRYIDGSWVITTFEEKHLRRALDEIEHLHGLPSLGQKLPRFLTVRVFARSSGVITIDLMRIRNDVTRMCPNQDVIFDLRVVTVNVDGSQAAGYLFPWNEIDEVHAQLVRNIDEIACRQCALPEDIDVLQVSQELDMSGNENSVAG